MKVHHDDDPQFTSLYTSFLLVCRHACKSNVFVLNARHAFMLSSSRLMSNFTILSTLKIYSKDNASQGRVFGITHLILSLI